MTIDEAIEELKSENGYYANNGITDVAEFNTKIIRWLEELKSSRQELNNLRKYSYAQGLSDGYINAIDDFVANVKDTLITDYSVFNTDDIRIFIDIIEELAEQLKAGASNGTNNQ